MIFKIGRDNFALTVMVPYDCKNNCAFCTAKEMYHRLGTNVEDVKFQLGRTLKGLSYPISDVVFTGGEPTADLDVLRELIDLVPADKNVYINTTLPAKNFDEFHDLVNDEPKIKGINVSRHAPTIDEDCKLLNDSASPRVPRSFCIDSRSSCGGGSGCGGPVFGFCGGSGLPTCGGGTRCG